MRAGAVTAAANITDDFALFNIITAGNGDRGHVAVSSFVTVAMADFYITAIAAEPACKFNISVCTGVNGCAVIVADINAGVVIITVTAERVCPAAEVRSNAAAGRRPDVRGGVKACVGVL